MICLIVFGFLRWWECCFEKKILDELENGFAKQEMK